jgi:UDP-glucose 4-epimerase
VYHQIHGVESIALRYFNVYGPRQNSQGGYAGVIKIFKEKVEQGEPLVVYGDGKQTRDFIFVGDVVEANIKAMESSIPYATMNIGTGIATNVNTIAYKTLKILKSENDIVYKPHRPGDPLHCYCNPEKAKNLINFTAKTELDHGMHMALFDHDLIVSR